MEPPRIEWSRLEWSRLELIVAAKKSPRIFVAAQDPELRLQLRTRRGPEPKVTLGLLPISACKLDICYLCSSSNQGDLYCLTKYCIQITHGD